MLRSRLQDDQGVASVLISSGSENLFLRQLSGQFYLVGSLFMVSISSAQPRFWLGSATDGAVGSSQFRGGRGSSLLRHFFPSMKHVAWAMQGASPWRPYIFSLAMSKRAALLAWLWQPMLAKDAPSLYMAQLGDMLTGLIYIFPWKPYLAL